MRFKLLLLLLLIGASASAQTSPKFEFRAAWIATVNNIDWPSETGLSIEQQKLEAISILDQLKKNGMNAIIFQIRPTSDAFYASDLEPWSRYLTGTPGKNPGYDPLTFWIKECHRRNMEFHAWFNPFRVAQKADEPLASSHIAFQHPDWIINYSGKLYFDPGIPEAREFVVKVVKDVVSRYDIDAIHFDDYFYPYPVADEIFPDQTTFQKYQGQFTNEQIEDWRRENVDLTIQMLSQSIKLTKPWVKFGISPFGVWRNHTDDPRGSRTSAGITSYDDLYGDILKWMENGWIDYAVPQIYWQFGHPSVAFELLCEWWNANRFNRALYIGHALYKLDPASTIPEWKDAEQIPRQIQLTREIDGIGGSAFYSAIHFNRDLLGLKNELQTTIYAYPAIVPPMSWIDNRAPDTPLKFKKSGRKLKWKTEETTNEMDRPNRFIIYMNKVGESFNSENPASILIITQSSKIKLSKEDRKKEKYEFRISSLDRLNNESALSEPIIIKW